MSNDTIRCLIVAVATVGMISCGDNGAMPTQGVPSDGGDAAVADAALGSDAASRVDLAHGPVNDAATACSPSADVCQTCLATSCCAVFANCLGDVTCAAAWTTLMTCRASGEAPDLCYGHTFLGDQSGSLGVAVTDCAIYGTCNPSCTH